MTAFNCPKLKAWVIVIGHTHAKGWYSDEKELCDVYVMRNKMI